MDPAEMAKLAYLDLGTTYLFYSRISLLHQMFPDASIALIFGGCCSNVFTLEAIVKHEPDSGLIITFIQFLLTVLFGLPTQLSSQPGQWLRRPQLPLEKLAFIALLFFSVNMLNNWAFAFDISVPLHIILRSFGSVTTLGMGWLYGKRYSRVQVGAVMSLTVGVVIAAWADASAKGKTSSNPLDAFTSSGVSSNFLPGLSVLFAAQLISAWMGVYVEGVYAKHGRAWQENMFYSHLLGLAFSLALWPSLSVQLRRLWNGPPASQLLAYLPHNSAFTETVGKWAGEAGLSTWSPSAAMWLLLANALTQVACIGGVNRLSAQTTAVTVTVVLNVRKLVSFLLSCFIFGNKMSGMMALGAGIVFVSGAVYGWDSSRKKRTPEKKAQ